MLHEGLTARIPFSFGLVTAITGAVVVLWIPLRQRPGVDAVANVIAVVVDVVLALLPEPSGLPARIALMMGGIVLNGVASAIYIGGRPA